MHLHRVSMHCCCRIFVYLWQWIQHRKTMMLNHYFQGCPSSQCHGTGSFLSHPESQGTLPVPRDKKSRSSEVGFKTTLGPRVVVRTTRPQFFYVWCCPTTTTTIYILEDKYPRGVSKYSHVGTHFKALWKCSLKIPFIHLFISFGI